jgi:hypothetical protein
MVLGLTGGIAVKKTYEKPTFVKSSVRLQAVTADGPSRITAAKDN